MDDCEPGTVERKLIMDEKADAAALVAWEAVRAEPLVAHRPKYSGSNIIM